MGRLNLIIVSQQFGGDSYKARYKACHDIKGNVGDPAFRRSKGVGPRSAMSPNRSCRLSLCCRQSFITLRQKVRISKRCNRTAIAAGMASNLSIRLAARSVA